MIAPGTAVLVTTAHRGVFMGYFVSQDNSSVTLTKMRNCLYWPAANRGFVGLATDGPLEGSRIGPAVEQATLYAVTAILRVTLEAVKRWEEAPWLE